MTTWELPADAPLTVSPPGFGAVQSVPAEVGPPAPRERGVDTRPVYTPPSSRSAGDPAARWAARQPRRPGTRARAGSVSGSSRGITKLVTHYDGQYGSSSPPHPRCRRERAPGQLVPPYELALADFARHFSLSARQRTAGAYLDTADRLRRACRVATARRMTGRFEHFDARPGGSYRLVLAYADASAAREVRRRLRRGRRHGRSPRRRPITRRHQGRRCARRDQRCRSRGGIVVLAGQSRRFR